MGTFIISVKKNNKGILKYKKSATWQQNLVNGLENSLYISNPETIKEHDVFVHKLVKCESWKL